MRSFVVLALGAAAVKALQFEVEIGKSKCLGEVIGRHDLVKGGFSVHGVEGGARSGVEVRIFSPTEKVEYSSDAPAGKFAFTGNEDGSHRVCFTNRGPLKRRILLDFAAGADATDYSEVAKKEHLKPIELELRKLEDRVAAVSDEMTYQREREEEHRNVNESTNQRVRLFSILTITIVLTQAVLQTWHLYGFLKKKKFL